MDTARHTVEIWVKNKKETIGKETKQKEAKQKKYITL
jgi:hypothetical protein